MLVLKPIQKMKNTIPIINKRLETANTLYRDVKVD